MKIMLITKNSWKYCTPNMKINELCKNWNWESKLLPHNSLAISNRAECEVEIKMWRRVENIIDYHKSCNAKRLNKPWAEVFHFGSSEDSDYDQVLGQDEAYRRQSFTWVNKDIDSDDEIPSDEDSEWEEGFR